jgi:hypothetical protein
MSLSSAIATAQRAQQAALEDANGDTVQINSTDYRAAIAPSAITHEMTEQGWKQVQVLVVLIRKNLLAARPAKDTAVAWNGHTYFVTATSGDAPNIPSWTIRARRVL